MAKKKPLLLTLTFLITSIYFISSLVVPLTLSPDEVTGFNIWLSMLDGSCFNCIKDINNNNISENMYKFNTWWSPGFYLIPGLISYLFKLKLSISTSITVYLFSIIGLVGFYILFIKFGFSKLTSSLALLIIASSRIFILPFTNYLGGELLLFSVLPYTVLIFFNKTRIKFAELIYLPILFSIFFIFKSSFLIVYVGIVAFFFLNYLFTKHGQKLNKTICLKVLFNKETLYFTNKIVFLSLIFYFTIYYLFISKGENPSTFRNYNPELTDFVFPGASPILSIFSIDSIFAKLYETFPSINSILNIEIICLLAIIFLFTTIYYLIKENIKREYKILTFSFLITYLIIFTLFYIFDSSISYNSRHFRIIGLLLLPFLIKLMIDNKISAYFKFLIILLFLSSTIYGISGFLYRYKKNIDIASISKHGFTKLEIDNKNLNLIHEIDKYKGKNDNLFCSTSPDALLEVTNFRKCYLNRNSLYKKYLGTVDNLIILIDTNFYKKDEFEKILYNFRNYKMQNWKMFRSKNFIFVFNGESSELNKIFLNKEAKFIY